MCGYMKNRHRVPSIHHCPLFTKVSAFNTEDLLLFSFEKHSNRIAILADFFTKPINLQRNLKNLNEMTFLSGWYTKLRMCMREPNLREWTTGLQEFIAS